VLSFIESKVMILFKGKKQVYGFLKEDIVSFTSTETGTLLKVLVSGIDGKHSVEYLVTETPEEVNKKLNEDLFESISRLQGIIENQEKQIDYLVRDSLKEKEMDLTTRNRVELYGFKSLDDLVSEKDRSIIYFQGLFNKANSEKAELNKQVKSWEDRYARLILENKNLRKTNLDLSLNVSFDRWYDRMTGYKMVSDDPKGLRSTKSIGQWLKDQGYVKSAPYTLGKLLEDLQECDQSLYVYIGVVGFCPDFHFDNEKGNVFMDTSIEKHYRSVIHIIQAIRNFLSTNPDASEKQVYINSPNTILSGIKKTDGYILLTCL